MQHKPYSRRVSTFIIIVGLLLFAAFLGAPFYLDWSHLGLGLGTLVILSIMAWVFIIIGALAYIISPKQYRPTVMQKLRSALDFLLGR